MSKTKAFIRIWKQFFKGLCQPWVSTTIARNKGTTADIETTNNTVNETALAAKENEEVDIDKEYMPHMWSRSFNTPEDVLQNHIDFMEAESDSATKTIPHELDIKYGSINEYQKLDIFGTDLPDDAPILAYFHGGYWKEFSKEVSRFPALSLHPAGIKTIVVEYSRCRTTTLFDIIDQIEDALTYLMNYAHQKNSRGLYLAGHCAGAHLLAQALGNYEVFDCHFIHTLKGVFLISGLYDLRAFCETSVNVEIEKMDAISMSPLYHNFYHLKNCSTRFYILAAQNDSETFKTQSRDFYNLLHDICPFNNTYLEVKDNTDHYEIVQCFADKNNFLKSLILHDISKCSSSS